jgi:hypothetical protein
VEVKDELEANIREYFSKLGKKGGAKSRRKLTKFQARAMSKVFWDRKRAEKKAEEEKKDLTVKP